MGTGQVWAVGMMRDEADVAADVLRHLSSEGVDGVIVADNNSTDNTRRELNLAADELADSGIPVHIVDDSEIAYYQSRKMSALAATAAEQGAEWIIPFDADEIWYAHGAPLATFLRSLPPDVPLVGATLWNHFVTAFDPDITSPFQSMVYRQPIPGALSKVAFRWQPGAVIHQGNHGVTLPNPIGPPVSGFVHLRHFPYRSFEHFKRKAINGLEAYRATDLSPTEGAHWRQYGEILERHGEDALREVYSTYFSFLAPEAADMVLDPAPFRRWSTF